MYADRDDAPPAVVWAVAAGVAPLPFLGVYAVLFITRGTVRPVIPPDVGSSKTDELLAGVVALALFVVIALGALWLLDRRRRWLFAVTQLAVLAGCCFLVSDSTAGSPTIPIALVVTTLVALALAFTPSAGAHLGRSAPGWPKRLSGLAGRARRQPTGRHSDEASDPVA